MDRRLIQLRIASIVTLLTLPCLCSSLRDDGGTRNYSDVTSMATPHGERLRAAEDGPIRSALGTPVIIPDSVHLTVHGLVDSSFTLDWNDIQGRPAAYSDTMLMYCVEGWEVWGNWKGISVAELLADASPHPNAGFVEFQCIDGYTTSHSIAYLTKYNAMLAYEVNGDFLSADDGFPLRLVAFGKFGYKWAKWVKGLEVMEGPRPGFWESRGYADQAHVPIDRRRHYEGPDAQPLEY
ncbi:molybdopterin-dependent oxidoreductase [candidate division KSB1 bacterium]